jgi:hypothetical protein
MKESSYLTLLGKLEHSDSWRFGDAFGLISDYVKHSIVLCLILDSVRTRIKTEID